MAVVTFDHTNRRIIEVSTGGDNVITWEDIYSNWKTDAKVGNNLGNAIAFTVVGGFSGLGATFFLENGWKFRPAELSHRVELQGNIFSVIGERVTADTLGAYTVEVAFKFSNLVDRFDALASRNLILPLYAGL